MRLARVVAQLCNDLGQLLVLSRGGSVARAAAYQDHPHGHARRLAGHSRIGVEELLELVHDVQIRGAEARESNSQRSAVRDDLVGVRIPQVLSEEGAGLEPLRAGGSRVAAMDEAQGVERPSLGVASGGTHGGMGGVGIVGGRGGGEVGFEQRHRLGRVAGVDDAHGGSGRELGPIAGLLHPIQIIPQKIVVRRPPVQVPVRRHRAVVQYRISAHATFLQRPLQVRHDEPVRVRILVQEAQR
mmetsp:Transcript_31663/g.76646  ORF Transcript_31663/g.76646 Transcript_31663/m.76646 type:complete len:242 (+) Transcript_31663:1681-2406(+)